MAKFVKVPAALDSKTRRVWLLAYSTAMFDAAKAIALRCIETNIEKAHPDYDALTTAIIVKYSLPFTGNDRLGHLQGDFQKFDDATLGDTHELLKKARNNWYAHIDPTSLGPLFVMVTREKATEPENAGKVWMKYVPHLHFNTLNPSVFPKIVKLCDFQRQRINVKFTKSAHAILHPDQAQIIMETHKAKQVRLDLPYPSTSS